jgi:hypothetical protein
MYVVRTKRNFNGEEYSGSNISSSGSKCFVDSGGNPEFIILSVFHNAELNKLTTEEKLTEFAECSNIETLINDELRCSVQKPT